MPRNSRTPLNAHRLPFESVMDQAKDASPQDLGSATCSSPCISDEQVWLGPSSVGSAPGQDGAGKRGPRLTSSPAPLEWRLQESGLVIRGLTVPDFSLRLESPFLALPCRRLCPSTRPRAGSREGPSTKLDGTSSSLARLSVPPRLSQELSHLCGSNTLPACQPHHCSSKPAPP